MTDLKNWTARPAPVAVALEGRTVSLEPYDRAKHLNALWETYGQEDVNDLLKYFAAPDFHSVEDFGRWIEACGKAGWIAEVFRDKATGKVIGMANYMRADPGNGVVEVGGVAHSRAMQRTVQATEVHYLMAKHVFDDLGYRRYEWKCNNGNAASKATAERYGFTFEGVFRKHSISRGANRDTAWFSIIDDEWPLVKQAFEAWLAPENFDGNGQQIRKLTDIRTELATR